MAMGIIPYIYYKIVKQRSPCTWILCCMHWKYNIVKKFYLKDFISSLTQNFKNFVVTLKLSRIITSSGKHIYTNVQTSKKIWYIFSIMKWPYFVCSNCCAAALYYTSSRLISSLHANRQWRKHKKSMWKICTKSGLLWIFHGITTSIIYSVKIFVKHILK